MTQPGTRGIKAGLIGGALAAIAASVCWVVPLVLVSIGVTGAWMSTFTVLAPYKGALLLGALGCTGYAGLKVYRVQPAGARDAGVAPRVSGPHRVLFWAVCALVIVAVASPYLVPLFFEE